MASAETAAEVLDARDHASIAYDAAKSAGRLARAKQAHDEVISTVYRAQADALEIESAAKRRLADEYDAAQERGEVATGRPKSIPGENTFAATVADIGLTSKDIHDARRIRDAEAADPGIVRRTLDRLVDAGEEPTRAAIKREIAPEPEPRVSDGALWLWGRLRDLERDGYLALARALPGLVRPIGRQPYCSSKRGAPVGSRHSFAAPRRTETVSTNCKWPCENPVRKKVWKPAEIRHFCDFKL